MIVNPRAASSRSIPYAVSLLEAYRERRLFAYTEGIETLVPFSDSRFHRKAEVVAAIRKFSPQHIIVVGGDGTVAEVLEAYRASGSKADIAFGHAGTSNDLARQYGVPRDPRKFWRFLRNAQPVPIRGAEIFLGNARRPKLIVHSASFGASGTIFDRGEKLKSLLGSRGILLSLAAHVPRATPFKVCLNGDRPNVVGDVIVAITSPLGGVVATPPAMEQGAARLFMLPMNGAAGRARGVLPLLEGAVRHIFDSAGFHGAVEPGTRILTLPLDYQVTLPVGRTMEISFKNLKGEPLAVPGVLNGDVVPLVRKVRVRPLWPFGHALAGPRSAALRFATLLNPAGRIANLFLGALFLSDLLKPVVGLARSSGVLRGIHERVPWSRRHSNS